MKMGFVQTKSVKAMLAAVDRVDRRGAPEKNILLITGQPGFGKTRTLRWWAVQKRALLLTAGPGMTLNSVLGELIALLGDIPPHSAEKRVVRLRQLMAGQKPPIIVDEAHYLFVRDRIQEAPKPAIVDRLRQVTEFFDVPLVLASHEEAIRAFVAKFDHLSSRIADAIDFGPCSLEDVVLICKEKCEVEVTDDLAEEIWRHTDGRARLIVDFIPKIEAYAKKNRLKTVSREAMSGEVVTIDWRGKTTRSIRPLSGSIHAVGGGS
ncbi:MAG: ATP-binding protein [Magnetococcales bacterium]|nr:ATP-binding protein [Magnetococcales bacterium]